MAVQPPLPGHVPLYSIADGYWRECSEWRILGSGCVTAPGGLPLRLVEHGDGALVAALAPILCVAANLVVVLLVFGTLRLLVTGQLLAQPVPVA